MKLMEAKQLSSIPETMLIPLWAKATECHHPRPILVDKVAADLLSRINYDFSRFAKARMSQVGCCVRAALIDQEVRQFLTQHPDAIVIQLGAGLDARYQRLGQPECHHWYDLDLPEGIVLRRQYIPESERNTYIAQSLFEEAWMQQLAAEHRPTLIIIEGVLMYFERPEVRAFFESLCRHFERATVLMDMLLYWGVKHSRHHDAINKTEGKNEFRWSELHTRTLETWHPHLHLGKEYFMSDYDQGRFPWLMRLLYKLPFFYRRGNQRIVRLEIGE